MIVRPPIADRVSSRHLTECKKGYKVCNNKCIKEDKDCSTVVSDPYHKRLAQRGAAASQCSAGESREETLGKRRSRSSFLNDDSGFTACSTSAGGFECLDTKRDIESC